MHRSPLCDWRVDTDCLAKMLHRFSVRLSSVVGNTGLTEGEKEEGAKAKEALNEDGEGSDDEGDTRKAATYGNKKNEVCFGCIVALRLQCLVPLQDFVMPVHTFPCFALHWSTP